MITSSVTVQAGRVQAEYKMGYAAAAGLLFLVLSQLPSIKRQLTVRFTPSQIAKIMHTRLINEHDNHTVLRVCGVVSIKAQQLPTQVTLLAYISQACLAFEQCSNWLYRPAPLPAMVAKEVEGASFTANADGQVWPAFRVLLADEVTWRPEPPAPVVAGSPSYLQRQFGDIVRADEIEPLFAKPLKVLQEAFQHGNGMEPALRVPAQLGYANGTILARAQLGDFCAQTGAFESCAEDPMTFLAVVLATIAQHGCFNKPGHGSPLITTVSIEKLATNAKSRSDAWCRDGEDFASFLERIDTGHGEVALLATEAAVKVGTLVDAVNAGDSNPQFARAKKLLMAVMCAVVSAATCVMAPSEDGGDWDEEDEQQNVDDSILSELTGRPDSELAAGLDSDSGSGSDSDCDMEIEFDGSSDDDEEGGGASGGAMDTAP